MLTVDLTHLANTVRLVVRDTPQQSKEPVSTKFVSPGLVQKLNERAEAATGSYCIVFETLQRRFERDHPQLLLAENWKSFVGVGTLAGCFTLAVSLHFEVPEALRTELELSMRERLELRCCSAEEPIYSATDDHWAFQGSG